MKKLFNKVIISIVLVVILLSGSLLSCTSNSSNGKVTTKKANVEASKEQQDKQKHKQNGVHVLADGDTSSVTGELKVHYINVGQADSILIQQGNENMLIDAGTVQAYDYLNSLGITKLDYVVATHPHDDHIGAIDNVINSFQIGKIYMPKVTTNTKSFTEVVNAIKNKGMEVTAPTPAESFKLGDAICRVLAPNNSTYSDLNDYSIVIKIKFGNNTFMFTGDAGEASEKEMLSKGYDLKADVLKVAHHGSSSANSEGFLSAVNPKYAVISVGKDNTYGLPDKTVMDSLKEKQIQVYRTDENGTIICTSDGNNISFNVSPGSYSSPDNEGNKVDQQNTNQSDNNRVVYYTPNGKSYHYDRNCPALARSKIVLEGKLQDVINMGKTDPCDKCVK